MWNLKKTHTNPKLIVRESRLVVVRGEGWGVGEIGEGGKKI